MVKWEEEENSIFSSNAAATALESISLEMCFLAVASSSNNKDEKRRANKNENERMRMTHNVDMAGEIEFLPPLVLPNLFIHGRKDM